MTKRQRRWFSREFKLEAVRLAKKSEQSLAQLERDLGLPSALLGRWVREFDEEGEEAFLERRRQSEQAKIRELERRISDLEEEREILKKAVAIFSRAKE